MVSKLTPERFSRASGSYLQYLTCHLAGDGTLTLTVGDHPYIYRQWLTIVSLIFITERYTEFLLRKHVEGKRQPFDDALDEIAQGIPLETVWNRNSAHKLWIIQPFMDEHNDEFEAWLAKYIRRPDHFSIKPSEPLDTCL